MSTIFISYAHQDEAWKERLVKHLKPLLRGSEPCAWNDHEIAGGDDWRERINQAMADARLAVLLISADFLSSEFITGVEVPELLRRREREGMRVFPILVQSCVWKQIEWLTPIQIRPQGAVPLASFGAPGCERVDEALAAIASEI